jgi:hypothetical protein
MTRQSRTATQGLTLAEWLFILAILTIIVGIVVAELALRSCDVRCLSIARRISVSIRVYANSWDGYAPPDPDYYVELAGFPLREGSPGGPYNPDQARRVTDFRCPLDKNPRLTRHGYYSSYCFEPWAFLGGIGQDPTLTPMLIEVGRRHRVPGTQQTSFSVVFLDLSARLAIPANILLMHHALEPGMPCIAWHTTAPAALFDALKTMPDIDLSNDALRTAKLMFSEALTNGCLSYDSDGWAWFADQWRDPDGGKHIVVNADCHELPANCVVRWEGFWKVPQDGANSESTIRLRGDWFGPQRGWLWLDANDNNVIEPKETLPDQAVTLEANRKYRLVVLWYNDNSNSCRARVLWRYDRPGETNYWMRLPYADCFHEPGATYFPP